MGQRSIYQLTSHKPEPVSAFEGKADIPDARSNVCF
jgi:hypothetical protein